MEPKLLLLSAESDALGVEVPGDVMDFDEFVEMSLWFATHVRCGRGREG